MLSALLSSTRAVFNCIAVSSIFGDLMPSMALHIRSQVPVAVHSSDSMKVELRRVRGGRRRMQLQAFKSEVACGMIQRRKVEASSGVARSEGGSGSLARTWQAREDLEHSVCMRRWAGDCSGAWGPSTLRSWASLRRK